MSCRDNVLFLSFVFIYVYWFPTLFPYQMMFVSFKSNTVTCGAGTANPSRAPVTFSGAPVARSLVFYVMFCISLFVLLSFFFCLLAIALFVLRLTRFLIAPVVSSNFFLCFTSVFVLFPRTSSLSHLFYILKHLDWYHNNHIDLPYKMDSGRHQSFPNYRRFPGRNSNILFAE
jgi:hypothetical protein